MHRDDCDAALYAMLQLLDHAVSSSQGDARRLASRACGLIFALTTPDAHFLEGDRNETPMTELARRFRRIVGDLTRAFIERDAPRRLVSALEALSKASSREDADASSAASSAAIKATRNLLLHTDERGAQLRKALAQSEMTVRVLEPFLARAVRDARDAETSLDDEEDEGRRGQAFGDDGWRERRVYERSRGLRAASAAVADALNALVVATHKDGTLRQRLLCGVGGDKVSDKVGQVLATEAASLVPRGVLGVECLASNLLVVDTLLRLACNLGVGVGDDGGGAPAKGGRERWVRTLTERCIDRLDNDAAVILSTRFAEEVRSAPVVRDCKTHEWLVSLLPEPTAPRVVVEAALKGGGGGGGGKRNRRGGGKSRPGAGGSTQRPPGGGKTEKEKARKREQKRRKKQREKEAKEARRRRDEASVEGESAIASGPAIARSPPKRVVGSDAAAVIEVRRSTPKVEDDEAVSDDGDGDEGSSLGGDSSGDDIQRVNEFKIGFGASSSSQRPVFVNPMFDSKEDALEGVDKLLEELDRLGF